MDGNPLISFSGLPVLPGNKTHARGRESLQGFPSLGLPGAGSLRSVVSLLLALAAILSSCCRSVHWRPGRMDDDLFAGVL